MSKIKDVVIGKRNDQNDIILKILHLLFKSKELEEGICITVNLLYDDKYINTDEYNIFKEWFDQFKPKIQFDIFGDEEREDIVGYWFKNNDDRIEFINQQIKLLTK